MTFKYSEYQKSLNSYIDYSAYPKFNIIGIINSGNDYYSNSYYGGVLSTNNKIYAIPRSATSVLEIDPIVGTATTFGGFSAIGSNRGGVLATNGNIYTIPYNATSIFEIDPISKNVNTFDTFSGTNQWWGGVLGPNGKIYGIPNNALGVLVIDPIQKSTTTIGNFSGTDKWKGGVLGPNGIIYGIPSSSSNILKIDPVAGTTSIISSSKNGFEGGVLGYDGKIYCIQGTVATNSNPAVFDTVTETFSDLTLIGSSSSSGYIGGILAPNGKIYSGVGGSTLGTLEIDISNQTYKYLGNSFNIGQTLVLHPNGKIYGLNSTYPYGISEYTPESTSAPADWLLSAYQNKF
jgi:hypothetical protein